MPKPERRLSLSYRAEWIALVGFLIVVGGMMTYLSGEVTEGMTVGDRRHGEIEALILGEYLLIALIGMAGLLLVQTRRSRSERLIAAAHAQVAESERFMRSLIDVMPGMVGYWTAELKCAFSNIAYQEWFGKSPEQMKGIAIQDLMGETLFRMNEPYIRGALNGQGQSFERTLTKADGSIGYTLASYVPHIDAGRVLGFFALVVDITRLKQAEIELRESQRFLSDLIQHSATPIYAKNRDGVYQLINDQFEKSTGLTREAVIGKTDAMIYPEVSARLFRAHDLEVMRTGQALEAEASLVGAGAPRHYISVKFPLHDAQGRISGVCGISTDITERKRAEEEIEKLSRTDVLTGLPNRRHFMEAAQKEVQRASRHHDPLSVLMMDIDHFKEINDQHGHQLGDVVLARLGRICMEVIREIDLPGRIGGEEFAIVLPQTAKPGAFEVAERLRGAIEQAAISLPDGSVCQLTVSIGVATSSGDEDLDELFMAADTALYQAKHSGRNRVC